MVTTQTGELPGWGHPGTIRHAEMIGRAVWLQEHPAVANSSDLDPTPVDDLETDYDPVESGRLDRLLDQLFGPNRCDHPDCVLPPHDARWRAHRNAAGEHWYPGHKPGAGIGW